MNWLFISEKSLPVGFVSVKSALLFAMLVDRIKLRCNQRD